MTFRSSLEDRFRGYLPVVVDVETSGLFPDTDALLEIAAVPLCMDRDGLLEPSEPISYAVRPFEGARMDPASLEFLQMDPHDPAREAVTEAVALDGVFKEVRTAVREHHCHRAILVGHNAAFDLAVVYAAANRCHLKRNPFHPFSTFDTVSLGAVVYGQTVLATLAQLAGLGWDSSQAHTAAYDATMTARLYCDVTNRFNAEYQRLCAERREAREATAAGSD